MTQNPRITVFQFIPFQLNSMQFKYAPSALILQAFSGTLSFTGKTKVSKGQVAYPHPPTNLLNTPLLGMSIASELNLHILSKERPKYKLHSILNDFIYTTYFPVTYRNRGIWNKPQGKNLLDGGAPFYDIYKAKEVKGQSQSSYLAVAPIEPKFFKILVNDLPLSDKKKEYLIQNQLKEEEYPQIRKILKKGIL